MAFTKVIALAAALVATAASAVTTDFVPHRPNYSGFCRAPRWSPPVSGTAKNTVTGSFVRNSLVLSVQRHHMSLVAGVQKFTIFSARTVLIVVLVSGQVSRLSFPQFMPRHHTSFTRVGTLCRSSRPSRQTRTGRIRDQ